MQENIQQNNELQIKLKIVTLIMHTWLSGRKRQTHNLFSLKRRAGSNPVVCNSEKINQTLLFIFNQLITSTSTF